MITGNSVKNAVKTVANSYKTCNSRGKPKELTFEVRRQSERETLKTDPRQSSKVEYFSQKHLNNNNKSKSRTFFCRKQQKIKH